MNNDYQPYSHRSSRSILLESSSQSDGWPGFFDPRSPLWANLLYHETHFGIDHGVAGADGSRLDGEVDDGTCCHFGIGHTFAVAADLLMVCYHIDFFGT